MKRIEMGASDSNNVNLGDIYNISNLSKHAHKPLSDKNGEDRLGNAKF